MRKSLIPILLSLVLIVSNAQAATKAGSPCSKAGAVSVVSGKRYICIKSGKKFVWNKGVLVVKASATPSATPTVKPTSQNVGFESELSPKTLAAYKDFIKTYKSRLTNEVPNIEFIIEPNMDKVLQKQIVDNINVAAKFFARERPLTVPLKIWVAMSSEFKWIFDNMITALPTQLLDGGWLDAKLGRAKAEPDGFMGGGAPGDDKSGTAVLFFNGSTRA